MAKTRKTSPSSSSTGMKSLTDSQTYAGGYDPNPKWGGSGNVSGSRAKSWGKKSGHRSRKGKMGY